MAAISLSFSATLRSASSAFFSSSDTRQAVSDAVGGIDHYACDRAMAVTNRHFTEAAKRLARSNHCELIDRDVLAEWISEFQEEGDSAPAQASSAAEVPG